MVIVIPFAICFRIVVTFTYNRTRCSVLIAGITHASFNEASEITKRARTPGRSSGVRLSRSVGTSRHRDQQRNARLQLQLESGCAPGCLRAATALSLKPADHRVVRVRL
jgi:hypothetical protein